MAQNNKKSSSAKKPPKKPIEQYRGTVSLPFEKEKHERVAVKILDDRGIESLTIVEIPA